ncbi:MAG: DUF1559 domain-containing protein [Planctomycetales bacterium]|nr:DUF1559 domain-containing protein [Planctomycetales bacterium]
MTHRRWSGWLLVLTIAMSGLAGCGGSEEPSAAPEAAPSENAAADPTAGTATDAAEPAADDAALSTAGDADAATTASANETSAAAGNSVLDLAYLGDQHLVAVIISPQRLLASNFVKPLLELPEAQMGMATVPPALLKAERVVVLAGSSTVAGPEDLVALISFSEPVDQDALITAINDSAPFSLAQRTVGDASVFAPPEGAEGPMLLFRDEKNILLVDSSRTDLKPAAEPATSELSQRLAALTADDLDKDLIVLTELGAEREEIVGQLEGAPIPAMAAGLLSSLQGVTGVHIAIDLDGATPLELHLRGVDEKAGQDLEGTLRGLLAMGQGTLMNQQADIREEEQASFELAMEALKGISIARDVDTVAFSLKRPAGLDAFVENMPQMIAEARAAAEQAKDANSMKFIALAMHNFHDTHGHFPPVASRGEDSKALLSWRVAILPFLEDASLYDIFDQKQAWDGDHNMDLVPHMPMLFGRGGDTPPGESNKEIFVGEGTPFSINGEGPKIADITDGTSNTIMFIEVPDGKTKTWTKPSALRFDPKDPLAVLDEIPGDTVSVAMFDGSTRKLRKDLPADTWRKLIQHQDGEAIDWTEIE